MASGPGFNGGYYRRARHAGRAKNGLIAMGAVAAFVRLIDAKR